MIVLQTGAYRQGVCTTKYLSYVRVNGLAASHGPRFSYLVLLSKSTAGQHSFKLAWTPCCWYRRAVLSYCD
jgi:hypothetical protein